MKTAKMRIVQIGGALIGAQKTIEEAIHSCALEQGHNSCILYARGIPSMDHETCYESKLENLITRGLRKHIEKNPHFSLIQTLRLIHLIKRFNPDIVHFHVLHNGCTDHELLFKFLAKAKIPVVYTMHDMWAFTGGCYHYTMEKCDGFRRGCSACPAQQENLDVMKSYVSKAYMHKKMLLESISKLNIVTVSNWVKEEVKKSFLSQYPIHVIPNGVFNKRDDTTTILSKKQNTDRIRIICIAASWGKRKGIDILLELAGMLDERFEVLIVGSVDDQYRSMAPENVCFYGYCADKNELAGLYASSDIHVSASQEETFGMTFIESALAGARCVGFASTAIRETINAAYGVAVDEYNAHALKEAVLEIVKNGSIRLTDEEIQTVKVRFSTDRMAKEYISLYSAILDE